MDTYRIPESNLWKLEKNLAKLNKRATKLGVEGVKVQTVGTEQVEVKEIVGYNIDGTPQLEATGRFRLVHIMTVEGVTPKLAGWTLQGVLEQVHTESGELVGNQVRPVPGIELPAEYRTIEPWCDHCKTTRRRNETFVVKNEDGTYKQVGRNCIVDFLGGADPKALMAGAELLFDVSALMSEAEDEGFGGGGYTKEYVTLLTVLENTAAVIRNDGWVSRKASEAYAMASNGAGHKMTTSAHVGNILFGKHDKAFYENYPVEKYKVTEADTAKAEAAIEWAKQGGVDQGNDYRYNLWLLANAGRTDRRIGLACSMLGSHLRELGQMAERVNQREINAKSEYLGNPDEKIEFTAVVEKLFQTSSDYGALNIYTLRTPEGNLLKWFTSSEDLAIDTCYALKGTVKRHETDKYLHGAKVTIVTRVKLAPKILSKEEKKLVKELKAIQKDTTLSMHEIMVIGDVIEKIKY